MAAGALTVEASSRADSKTLGQGTLLLINNEIDQTTGTIQLKATFPSKDHALWPGQFVDVQLLVETRHNAVTVPSAAVQLGHQGVYAYAIKAGDEVQMVPIKVSTAIASGPIAPITSGLSGGDQVVIDGQLKLRPGVTVKAAAAASAATAQAPSPVPPSTTPGAVLPAVPASAPAASRAPP
jgi:multidrug efflux system membrane fusion protein